MTFPQGLRVIPVSDRAWLMAALDDALGGGAPILPVSDDTSHGLQDQDLPPGTAVVIRTSGSTGIPKSVALSAAALKESAEATHARLGGPGQWLVTLPANLISGLQMLVRSSVAGTQPVFFDGPFDAAELLEAAELLDHERRYVSLVPVQLGRLLDLAERDAAAADALRRFDAVLVGGQAVSLELRKRAHDLDVNLFRSYGMSETAGGCVYDGVELGETYVRIRGGEVQLSGPTLALGYVGDEALTAERFITDEGGHRWYRTGDAGDLLGGMLTVTGRLDRVIISGGINVSLDEVERVLGSQPGWADALASRIPHPEWGERVQLVRSAADGAASFDDVAQAIRGALGVAAMPVGVTEIDEIPRLSGGKPDRVRIAEFVAAALAEAGAAGDPAPAAATQTETTAPKRGEEKA